MKSQWLERLVQISANLYVPETQAKQEQLEQRSCTPGGTKCNTETAEACVKDTRINVSSGEDCYV